MTTQPRLLVYKASAGSGKTFTLAIQYIKHLTEDPFAYRRILAVTFTNKATAEMKARILEQLYGLSHHLKSSKGYMDQLVTLTGKSEKEIEIATRKALQNILHDYSRFRIETIDSFFQSVLRNLARELGIGTNMNIELNQDDALSDAVDAMIEKLGQDSYLIHVVLECILERISDNKKWDFSKELKSFSKNIFKEEYVEEGEDLRKTLSKDPQFIPNFKKQVKEIQEKALDQMKGFSDQFFGLLDKYGLSVDDLTRKKTGIASYFKKLADPEKVADEKTLNTTVEEHLKDAKNWVTKSNKQKDTIIPIVERELLPLLETAEDFRKKNAKLLNSCMLSVRFLNNLQLLSNVSEEMHEQNVLRNRFMLSETNALLHNLISEGDASFIYEKIGTTIDIVMIDEFQDTSKMQWENFRILLEESLSKRDGSLIVGDIKQSIYRWRGGDWNILGNIAQYKDLRPEERTLDTNWRSEANIVQFNNEFFTSACQYLTDEYDKEGVGSSEPLINAYQDVKQLTSKKTQKGYVKITLLPKEKEFPYQDTVLKGLADEVTSLIRNGMHTNDIAILIRENYLVPIIADYFERNTPYRIVSDEAFRLEASLAVSMMIDALRYLVAPDNTIAKARLAVAFQQEILHKDIDLNTILLNNVDDYLPAEFLLRTDELRFMPLYELLETLFELFDMKKIEKQDAYLCAFYDKITDYLQRNSSELTSFITYWDETMHSKTIPSGEIDGIRILTIHKSKGLEYSTVLVPFCDWALEKSNNLIWCSVSDKEGDAAVPFNQLKIAPIQWVKAMKNSVYKESYANEKLQILVDNLNLLYVAFTRACHNLIVWTKNDDRTSVSAIVSNALTNIKNLSLKATQADDSITLYEYGELLIPGEKEKVTSDNPLRAVPESVPIHVESIRTNIEFRQSNQSAQFINGEAESDKPDYIQQGQLLHQVFASIQKASDVPQSVDRLCLEGVIASAEQKAQILKLAEWALKNPHVKSWYDGTWQLYNECSIIYTDSKGVMQTRRPDRVMVKDGQVVVVDFKFGKKHDEYTQQVQEYMQLLSRMGYDHIKGYLWYVFANELEEVNL